MAEKIQVALQSIEKVVRVYSGHPGCACGCQGRYWPEDGALGVHQGNAKDQRAIKRIYNIFQSVNPASVYTYTEAEDHFVCLDVSATRTYTMYYR
jgi:hypothetical protein